MPEQPHATVIAGTLAARALRECGGALMPVPDFPDAPYRLAGETLIWIGHAGPRHPRAIFCDASRNVPVNETLTTFACPDIAPHHPETCRGAFARLLAAVANLAPASGFAPMLRSAPPSFPLDLRLAEARAAARAARADDATAFVAPARRLLGAGAGLTPSGDDFVGAMLFARHHLGLPEGAWATAAQTLRRAAPDCTHRIGVALFDDLASGHSFEALHALMAAAHADASTDILLDRARAVTAIGHSSGWDMLTGLIAATAGLPAPRTTH